LVGQVPTSVPFVGLRWRGCGAPGPRAGGSDEWAGGFCGSLVTYSTFAHETVTLAQRRAAVTAGGYLVASVAAGLVAAVLGHLLGTVLAGR
jgi:CrcB protein